MQCDVDEVVSGFGGSKVHSVCAIVVVDDGGRDGGGTRDFNLEGISAFRPVGAFGIHRVDCEGAGELSLTALSRRPHNDI